MLNYIWPLFIISSIIYGIMSGNLEELNNSVFKGAEDAITTTITLLGSLCLWSGIMSIAEKTTFVNMISKKIQPIVKFLFPELKNEPKIMQEVSMNIIANILRIRKCCNSFRSKSNKLYAKEK